MSKEYIFHSKSPSQKIGADKLRNEQRYGNGQIKTASQVITFVGHIFRTTSKREADYIRGTQSFVNGQVKEIVEADVANIERAKVAVHTAAMANYDEASGNIDSETKNKILEQHTK